MKSVKKAVLDCISFSYKEVSYVLPTVAFAEFGVKGESRLLQDDIVLGTTTWRGLNLPLIAPDLTSHVDDVRLYQLAIVNALFLNKSAPPYFAILIDKHPIKLKIRASELTWIDEAKRIAVYSKERQLSREIVIPDLQKISEDVERVTSLKSP